MLELLVDIFMQRILCSICLFIQSESSRVQPPNLFVIKLLSVNVMLLDDIRPRGYKTFFMVNSTEFGTSNAHEN